MGNPKFFAWPFLASHSPVCFLSLLRHTFSLSTDCLHRTFISHQRLPCPVFLGRQGEVSIHQMFTAARPNLKLMYKLHLTVGWAVPTCSCRCHSFLPAPLWHPPHGGCQIGKSALSLLCFSPVCPKAMLFWASMPCLWIQIPAPMVDSHFYSSVTEINHLVKFIMPGFLSLRGSTFQGTHSGLVLKGFEKDTSPVLSPVCLNYSDGWSITFFFQWILIYFHQACFISLANISEVQQLVLETPI